MATQVNAVKGSHMFHGAGLPVTAPLFCKPCLDRGHQCPAREGGDECIFCEDGAPCPVMQRAVSTQPQRPTSSSPRLQGDSLLSPKKLNANRAKPVVTVHAASPQEFLKRGGKELIRAAVKEWTVNKETSEQRTCSEPGCGKKLIARNQSGRCTKHFYVPKSGRKNAGGAKRGKAAA